MEPRPGDPEQRSASLGELFKALGRQLTSLLRQEVELAKAELSEAAQTMAKGAGIVAAGAVLCLAGLLVLLWAVTIGLTALLEAIGVPLEVAAWLAPLVLAILFLGVGALVAKKGADVFAEASLKPQQTRETLEENKAWLKTRI